MMAMVPLPLAPQPPVRSAMLVDSVLVNTCPTSFQKKARSWGRDCVMPVAETVCDAKQLVNSVVTGILVPVLGWLIVRSVFNGLPSSVRQVSAYDFTNDQGDFPTCKVQGILICCIIAILACGAVAAASSTAISYAFGAAGCVHGIREMVVVGCATGVPTCIAMIIGLMYLYHSGSRHQDNKDNASSSYVVPKGQKLMLLEVPEGANGSVSGVPINPDILQTGTSAMASYSGAGFPSSITVDQTASNLSSYQSPGGM